MKGVGTKGRLLLGEGPVKVSFLFLDEVARLATHACKRTGAVLPSRLKACDTGVVLATHMSHTVPEICIERGFCGNQ